VTDISISILPPFVGEAVMLPSYRIIAVFIAKEISSAILFELNARGVWQ